jgi:hypothetical protein
MIANEILAILKKVAVALPTGDSNAAINVFMFSKKSVSAFDRVTYGSYPLKCNFEGALDSKLIVSVLTELGDREVEFVQGKTGVTIKSGAFVATLPFLPDEGAEELHSFLEQTRKFIGIGNYSLKFAKMYSAILQTDPVFPPNTLCSCLVDGKEFCTDGSRLLVVFRKGEEDCFIPSIIFKMISSIGVDGFSISKSKSAFKIEYEDGMYLVVGSVPSRPGENLSDKYKEIIKKLKVSANFKVNSKVIEAVNSVKIISKLSVDNMVTFELVDGRIKVSSAHNKGEIKNKAKVKSKGNFCVTVCVDHLSQMFEDGADICYSDVNDKKAILAYRGEGYQIYVGADKK